jgi:NADPH-dependent 2,4-dienoyl-CoA reductase/sulfur reductase-like enzyme
MEILVYERGPDISYSACGLPYLIAGHVRSTDALRVYSPDFFRQRRNIQVFTGREVVEISPSRRRVVVSSQGAALEEIHFDRLVIATGAEPVRPEISGLELTGVFHVNDLQSTLALKRFLDGERPRCAVILGGSYIGLEMAEALRRLGLEVTLIDRSTALLESVDEEISALIEKELESNGVRVLKDAQVEALMGDRSLRVRRLGWKGAPGGGMETEVVVLATGIRPRTRLAAEAGIQLGPSGALAVSEFMETSAPAIYAAGDVAEARHLVTGKPTYIPLGTTANKQGRVAGENAAGGRARFAGIVGTAAVKVFNLEVARTGLNRTQAQAAGFRTAVASISGASRARYLGGQEITTRLIADRATGRLLGAQMAGPEGVAKRIDVLATALHAGMTVEQIAALDLSYAPPFATVWDPILIAAQEMLRELRR